MREILGATNHGGSPLLLLGPEKIHQSSSFGTSPRPTRKRIVPAKTFAALSAMHSKVTAAFADFVRHAFATFPGPPRRLLDVAGGAIARPTAKKRSVL
jgi:hypothetical protein